MLIKLDEYLSSFTEGIKEHSVEGDLLKDGVEQLLRRYPRLQAEVTSLDSASFRKLGITIDGEFATTNDAPYLYVKDSIITLELVPTGEMDNFTQMIVGVAMIVVGVVVGYVFGWTGVGLVAAEFLISNGVGMLVSAAIKEAFFTPNIPTSDITPQSILNNSATYTFDGIKNTTASGTAIQIVYGTHRVGGHVIGMYTRSST